MGHSTIGAALGWALVLTLYIIPFAKIFDRAGWNGWTALPFPVPIGGMMVIWVFAWGTAWADEAAQCQGNGGTYVTGRVTAAPVFARGRHPLRGIELSHTHLALLSDQNGRSWDIAVDNVFASGYDAAGESVPAPLSHIRVGDRLEVCGRPFMDDTGPGLDWVHSNCGAMPTARKPNGWLKILGARNVPGPNIEASQQYCYLWSQRARW